MIRLFLIALQFLTLAPVWLKRAPDERELRDSAVMYPVVGFLIGLVCVGAYAVSGLIWPPAIPAAMVLAALVMLTGGLHMDGLSDTVDGLSAQGGQEQRLKAMRDPSAGPLGVTAVVFIILIKYLGIRSLEDLSYFGLLGTLLFMPLMGRWAMVVAMAAGRPAQGGRLGRVYLGALGMGRLIASAAAALGFLALGAFLLNQYAPTGAYLFLIASFLTTTSVALSLNIIFIRRLGGQSGDTLGATCEISEAVFLLGALAWSKFYIL